MEESGKKPKNIARTLKPDWHLIKNEVFRTDPATFDDVMSIVDRLYHRIMGSDRNEIGRATMLYSPDPWGDLSVADLDARSSPLPDVMVPKSLDELRNFYRTLLDRTGRFDIAPDFRFDPDEDKWLKRLWNIRSDQPEFFQAVVRGYHGSAVKLLDVGEPLKGQSRDHAEDAIRQMALLYAAHDVQTTAARARIALSRPAGKLMRRGMERWTSATTIAIWRPVYRLLERLLNSYRTNDEIRCGKREGKLGRTDAEKFIGKAAAAYVDRSHLADLSRRRRDDLVQSIRNYIAGRNDAFWNAVTGSQPATPGRTTSQDWYSELTPLQMTAVAVLRFLQIEAALQRLPARVWVAELASSPFTLAAFDTGLLPRDWRSRARRMVETLRLTIIKDPDLHTRRELERGESGMPNHDDTFIEPALEFLRLAAHEELPSNASELTGHRKTLALLNIATSARFQR